MSAFAAQKRALPGGQLAISSAQDVDADATQSAASLLFGAGDRPHATAIQKLAREDGGFAVSFDPGAVPSAPGAEPLTEGGQSATQWIELLTNGLTFDLSGLAPGPSGTYPAHRHAYGLAPGFETQPNEAVTLKPGPHLSSGASMLPVIRSTARLAALLSAAPGVRAVAWHPARLLSAPETFRESVLRWIENGVFPVFSLVALAPAQDGAMESEGLALFTGQELRLEPGVAPDRASAGRICVRLLHGLAEQGALSVPETWVTEAGDSLLLAPSEDGRVVRVTNGLA